VTHPKTSPEDDTSSQPGLGQRLKELRLRRGLSQVDLAGDTLSASAISLLESGRREPTIRTLEVLADRLGCTFEYLRDGVEPRKEGTVRLNLLDAELALRKGTLVDALARFDAVLADPKIDSSLAQRARLGQAMALEATGNTAAAIELLERLREEASIGNAEDLPSLDVDVALSRCYRQAGRHEESFTLTVQAVQLAESLGLAGMANHSELVINLIYELRQHNRAADAVEVARRHLETTVAPVTLDRALAYREASGRAALAGRTAEAVLLAERALAVHGAVADTRTAALLQAVSADLLLHHCPAEVEPCTSALERAYELLQTTGSYADLVFCEVGLAEAANVRGAAEQAAQWAEKALERFGDRACVDRARAFIALGHSRTATGDAADALRCSKAAAEVLDALPLNRSSAVAWRKLGALLRYMGEYEPALDAYERAMTSATGPIAAT
jgi:transcriptional regulator with XRE-family HTH domain